MKKQFIVLSLFFLFQGLYAQEEKIIQELQKFTELKAFDGIAVNLIPSTENKAIITGANTQKVVIVNNGGKLKVRMQLDKIFSGYRTFIDLYFTEKLTLIDVNEDARITSEETFTQNVLELRAQEGGELILNCQTEQMLIKAVTGGRVTTSGFTDNQDIIINTGGSCKSRCKSRRLGESLW